MRKHVFLAVACSLSQRANASPQTLKELCFVLHAQGFRRYGLKAPRPKKDVVLLGATKANALVGACFLDV